MKRIGDSRYFGAPLELGQSGAILTLVQSSTGTSIIVKKDEANTLRLQKQYEKQKAVKASLSSYISVPKILSDFSDSSFSMEFIHGQTLGQFLETSTREDLISVLDQLKGYLGSKEQTVGTILSIEPLAEKILSIKHTLSESFFNPIFMELADTLITRMVEISAVSGFNHGDFSFENLLVEKFTNKIYAIDFLDSPVETRLVDYGRLWLDVNFGWWTNWGIESTRYALNRSFIKNTFTLALDSQNIPKLYVEFFCGVAILRIAPYTKNPRRIAFLQHAARQLVKELKWS